MSIADTTFSASLDRRPQAPADGKAPIVPLVPPHWFAQALHQQTEGNPLFLREIVRFLEQQGVLSAEFKERTAVVPPMIRIPEGVKEVICRRVNFLSATCDEALAIASVVGRDFSQNAASSAAYTPLRLVLLNISIELAACRNYSKHSPTHREQPADLLGGSRVRRRARDHRLGSRRSVRLVRDIGRRLLSNALETVRCRLNRHSCLAPNTVDPLRRA
jgi:hypothetical protein